MSKDIYQKPLIFQHIANNMQPMIIYQSVLQEDDLTLQLFNLTEDN